MTPEQLKQAGEVMIAAGEGKDIQCRARCSVSTWKDVTTGGVSFDWMSFDYRVKPQPLRYKRYVAKNPGVDQAPSVHTMPEGWPNPSLDPRFVRWIDTEWQEVGL